MPGRSPSSTCHNRICSILNFRVELGELKSRTTVFSVVHNVFSTVAQASSYYERKINATTATRCMGGAASGPTDAKPWISVPDRQLSQSLWRAGSDSGARSRAGLCGSQGTCTNPICASDRVGVQSETGKDAQDCDVLYSEKSTICTLLLSF